VVLEPAAFVCAKDNLVADMLVQQWVRGFAWVRHHGQRQVGNDVVGVDDVVERALEGVGEK
jgi:hypothetical protein